jgi:hypothetical protein
LGFNYWNNSKFPNQNESQTILRLLGEKELSPMLAMRMGLNFFYGWGKGSYKFDASGSIPESYMDDIPFDGSGWGIGASLGGTVKFQRFSLEPFLGGGYQRLKLRGDGTSNLDALPITILDQNGIWKAYFIVGGFSVKF